ncbi:MAG: YbhB/YbcL family Raf kinase inhibitor-like protein [Candidatus Woesearchaeota archaeon]
MKITSDNFEEGANIPYEHTCDGNDKPPILTISDIPESSESLALIVSDPDAPSGTFIHWVLWNIPSNSNKISEGDVGQNSFGNKKYNGPCPPSGTHRYYFTVYALDSMLDLPGDTSKDDLEEAMTGHIIEEAKLMGKYTKA